MTEEQIKYMTERFLQWKLPETFNPDGGISFAPTYMGVNGEEFKRTPSGTNLFDYNQAREMILFMLEGLPIEQDKEESG